MQVLFLSGWFPCPQDNGSKIRIYNLLKSLAGKHRINLITFSDSLDASNHIAELNTLCERVEVIPWKRYNPASRKAILGTFSSAPRSLIDTYSVEMAQAIRNHLSGNCDVVVASEITFLPYHQILRNKPVLLEDLELAAIYDQCATGFTLPRLRRALTWLKTKNYVSCHINSFRACTVVSDREHEILRRAAPDYDSVEVIPNCIDFARYSGLQTEPSPNSLIFTGSLTFSANYDAVSFFLADVFPIIRKQCPDVRLRVTGRYDGVSLASTFADECVELLGYIPDVLPLLTRAWISIVPLRQGGGTRLKILEAMASGTPVVTTSKGAEGLEVSHGKDILIADQPEDFAACVIQLLQDPALRARLSANARQLVWNKYNWQSVLPRFLALVESIAAS